MLRGILLLFILGSTFYQKVDSSANAGDHRLPEVTTNDTVLELYKLLRNTETPSLEEVAAIKASDTIKSYRGHITDGNFYAVGSYKWRVVFPTINSLEGELLLAELHVKVAGTTEYLVGVDPNHMLGFPCDSSTPLPVCRKKKLLTSLESANYIEARSDEGVIIDFTNELLKWFSPEGTITRMVELWTYMGTAEMLQESYDFTDAWTTERRGEVAEQEQKSKMDGLQNINLVVYTRGYAEKSIVHDRFSQASPPRLRRSTDAERMERRRKKKEKQLRKERREELKRAKEEKLAREAASKGPCRVVEMLVDFEDIGWSKWILYPTSFNAKRCAGGCSGPLEAIHNPSNHAVMQDLIRLKMPGRAPEPCCIPTELQPLSMLYVEDGAIVVRHHEEMVAMECGCR